MQKKLNSQELLVFEQITGDVHLVSIHLLLEICVKSIKSHLSIQEYDSLSESKNLRTSS